MLREPFPGIKIVARLKVEIPRNYSLVELKTCQKMKSVMHSVNMVMF